MYSWFSYKIILHGAIGNIVVMIFVIRFKVYIPDIGRSYFLIEIILQINFIKGKRVVKVSHDLW